MRICLRCGAEMEENYGLKIESFLAGVAPVRLAESTKYTSKVLERIKVAVCPKCGELSMYVETEIKNEE